VVVVVDEQSDVPLRIENDNVLLRATLVGEGIREEAHDGTDVAQEASGEQQFLPRDTAASGPLLVLAPSDGRDRSLLLVQLARGLGVDDVVVQLHPRGRDREGLARHGGGVDCSLELGDAVAGLATDEKDALEAMEALLGEGDEQLRREMLAQFFGTLRAIGMCADEEDGCVLVVVGEAS